MSSHIRELSLQVRSKLRSGVTITSVGQCIEELVLNAVDSGASTIAVRVDLDIFRLQVVDNGGGISELDMKLIGSRYCTSKCRTLDDLRSNLTKYGFRGEALASIIQISGIVDITSRCKESNKTFSKLFTYGKEKSTSATASRPSCGTTITIQDFMYNMPVRRKLMKEAIDIENIRSQIERIVMILPNISISLRNDRNNMYILQIHKSRSVLDTFLQIFGKEHEKNMAEIFHSLDQFKVHGYISTQPHQTKNLQFVYINKRSILRSKVHSFVNELLSRSSIIRNRILPNTAITGPGKLPSSPPKGVFFYGIFILCISCPRNEYDICLEPKKTLIEFRDWEKVLLFLEEMILKFIKEENLAISMDDRFRKTVKESSIDFESPIPHSSQEILKVFTNTKYAPRLDSAITLNNIKSSVSDVRAAVCGLPARRDKRIPSNTKDENNEKQNSLLLFQNTKSPHKGSSKKDDKKTHVPEKSDSNPESNVDEYFNKEAESYSLAKSNGETQNSLTVVMSNNEVNSIIKGKCNNVKSSLEALKKVDCFNQAVTLCEKDKCVATNSVLQKPGLSSIQGLRLMSEFNDWDPDSFITPANANNCPVSVSPGKGWNVDDTDLTMESFEYKKINSKSFSGKISKPSLSKVLGEKYKEKLKRKKVLTSLQTYQYRKLKQDKKINNIAPSLLNKNEEKKDNTDNCEVFDQSFHFNPVIQPSEGDFSFSNRLPIPKLSPNVTAILDDMDTEELLNKLISNPHCQTYSSLNKPPIEDINIHNKNPNIECSFHGNKELQLLGSDLRIMTPAVVNTLPKAIEHQNSIRHTSLIQHANVTVAESHCKDSLDGFSSQHFDIGSNNIKSNGYKPTILPTQPFIVKNANLNGSDFSNKSSAKSVRNNDFDIKASTHPILSRVTTQVTETCSTEAVNISVKNKSDSSQINQQSITYVNTVSSDKKSQNLSDVNPDLKDFPNVQDHSLNIKTLSKSLEMIFEVPESSDIFSSQNSELQEFIDGFLSSDKYISSQSQPCQTEPNDNSIKETNQALIKSCNLTKERDWNHPLQNVSNEKEILQPPYAESSGSKSTVIQDSAGKDNCTENSLRNPNNLLENIFQNVVCNKFLPDKSLKEPSTVLTTINNETIKCLDKEQSKIFPENKESTTDSILGNNKNISDNKDLQQLNQNVTDIENEGEKCVSRNMWKAVTNSKGQKIYLNLRTGNSSFQPPPSDPTPEWNASQPMGCPPLKVPITDDIFEISHREVANQGFILSHGYKAFLPSKRKKFIDQPALVIKKSSGPFKGINDAEKGEIQDPPITECEVITNDSERSEPGDKLNKKSTHDEVHLSEKTYIALQEFLRDNLGERELSKWNRDANCSENLQNDENVSKFFDFEEMPPDFPMDADILHFNVEGTNKHDFLSTIKTYNIIHPYKFSREMLKKCKVFGQVDKKFVAVILSLRENSLPHLVVFVDQHAADERVQLEKVWNQSYEFVTSGSEGIERKVLKSARVNPPLEIQFSADHVRLLMNFRNYFLDLGLDFTQVNETNILFHQLPYFLVAQDQNEKYTRRCQTAAAITKATVVEVCDEICTIGGASLIRDLKHARPLPRSLSHVMNTIACRSAIKFGDSLSPSECSSLISSLAECQLPFQCAHGRPSLVPIVDLNYLKTKPKVSKPNLQRLTKLA